MLTHLTIESLAVVESASLELSPGLNVLTGETGAGKSVIVDALELLRGGVRSRARVRDGAAAASVEAELVPPAEVRRRLSPIFERYDLKLDEEIILGRRIDSSGRTRSYVQGRLVPRSVLAEVGEQLVEICGQHESHALRTASAQLEVLDRFGALEDEAARVSAAYAEYRQAEAHLAVQRSRQEELEKRRDFVSYQLDELGRVDLADLAQARARLELVRRASELRELCALSLDTLSEGEDSLSRRLAWLVRRASIVGDAGPGERDGRRDDGEDVLGPLRDALAAVEDALSAAARQASLLTSRTVLEAGELEELERQVNEAERLAHKHRSSPEELVNLKLLLERELEDLVELGTELPRLERELALMAQRVERLAAELHESRRRAASALGKAAQAELEALCLSGASLEVLVERAPLGPQGISAVEFSFCPNPGQSSAPLGRIASGGELSRVLLALRVASRHAGGLSVFDEIDAGAGGHVAERIGERLRRAARSGQVLCVTHWPQVAAYASAHFLVSKHTAENTTSRVSRLEGPSRVDELSRMLGGSLASARSHATALLAAARGDLAQGDLVHGGHAPNGSSKRRPSEAKVRAA